MYGRPHTLGVVRMFAHFSLRIQNRKKNEFSTFFSQYLYFFGCRLNFAGIVHVCLHKHYSLNHVPPFFRLFVFTIIISFRFVCIKNILKFFQVNFMLFAATAVACFLFLFGLNLHCILSICIRANHCFHFIIQWYFRSFHF